MRVVIQRVSKASVRVDGEIVGSISKGLWVFLGITRGDDMEDVSWLVKKTIRLRIFNDTNDVMNLSLLDTDGELLVVSQFTLHALTKKGTDPPISMLLSQKQPCLCIKVLWRSAKKVLGRLVSTGIFGAMMDVQICNDGPVTILMDSKQIKKRLK